MKKLLLLMLVLFSCISTFNQAFAQSDKEAKDENKAEKKANEKIIWLCVHLLAGAFLNDAFCKHVT